MNRVEFISRFSPNRTSPDVLEQMYVQRHDLLAKAFSLLRESALSESKHHLLFIGPRGSGKTHLLALIHHRLENDAELQDCLRIAWLNEDETSTTFLDLLIRIYRALAVRYPSEFPKEDLSRIYGRNATEALHSLEQALVERIQGRTLLVLVENLDMLFNQLEEGEQRTWRAFIQNHGFFCTAATAQALFPGVSDQSHAFFGFFETHHLKPLSVTEATELLQKIARLNGNTELLTFLGIPRGRARVRAIHHLSGGNHRLYIVLSDFITRESLDELVRPFEEMVDEQLTPYYQERLRWVSPQQRKIVELLCFRSHPIPVKEIADRLFASHATITNQLKQLRELGYVVSHPRGRESLYELAEPLMRLSMQVKDTRRNQPLDLLVDFLRVWYEPDELRKCLERIDAKTPGREYFTEAVQRLQSGEPNLRFELLRQEFDTVDVHECDEKQLECLQVLAEESGEVQDWSRYADACYFRRDFDGALRALNQVLSSHNLSEDVLRSGLSNRAFLLARAGQLKEAITDYSRLIQMGAITTAQKASALFKRGTALAITGQYDEAIADFSAVVNLPKVRPDHMAQALMHRGAVYLESKQLPLALDDFQAVANLKGARQSQIADSLANAGAILAMEEMRDAAIEMFSKALKIAEITSEAKKRTLANRALSYLNAGNVQQALVDYSTLIDLVQNDPEQLASALFDRGVAYGTLGKTDEEIDDYTKLLSLPNVDTTLVAKTHVNLGTVFGKLGKTDEEIAEYTRVIDSPNVPQEPLARALFNRAITMRQLNNTDAAIRDYSQIIALSSPPLDEWLVKALIGRANTFVRVGRTSEAVTDFSKVLNIGGEPHQIMVALLGRGTAYCEEHRYEQGIDDLSRIIESEETEPQIKAVALMNRSQAHRTLKRQDEELHDYRTILKLLGAPTEVVVFAQARLVESSFLDNDWDGAMRQWRELVTQCSSHDFYLDVCSAAVSAIFKQVASTMIWTDRIGELINFCSSIGTLVYLGDALVRHLSQLGDTVIGPKGLQAWAEAWEASGAAIVELRLPLRLLKTGIEYLKTTPRDRSILLQLPIEERTLVEQTLGLAKNNP